MSTQQTAEGAVSDYDRIGGGAAVRVVVDRFYELILADDRLASFFTDTDMAQLKRHQVFLISQVLGGPASYEGRELQAAHAGLQIRPQDFALVVSYLVQALQEAGVDDEVIGRVGAALSETEKDVVTAEGS